MSVPVEAIETVKDQFGGSPYYLESVAERVLAAAEPAMRAAVIAEVVAALRGETSARPPGTYPAQSNYNNMCSYADFIERTFGASA